MMSSMTHEEQPEPDEQEIQRLGTEVAHQLNRVVIALLVETVNQAMANPQSEEHDARRDAAVDLSRRSLEVRAVTPDLAVLATARAAGIAIAQLCQRTGADAKVFIETLEEFHFRGSL
jgi:hypothetical protein